MIQKLIRPRTILDQVHSLSVKPDPKQYIRGEWIVTNGLGGYSSSTIIGVMTRKYHALLVAALPHTYGRMIMLNHLIEELIVDDKHYLLNCEENEDGTLNIDALAYLKDFYLEDGLPVWSYQINDIKIEKRILMTYRQNTVYIYYKLLEGPEKIVLKLSPCLNFRSHESSVSLPVDGIYAVTVIGNRYEISKKEHTPLRLFVFGDERGKFTIEEKLIKNVFFRSEMRRGYESIGELWNPGYFQFELKQGEEGGIVASTENWQNIDSLTPIEAKKAEILRRRLLLQLATPQDEMVSELTLAADQFVITPESRVADAVRAHAAGEEIRTIIAGYHWFTDWGRDTMISLEGLTLCTKRHQEARWILKTFAHYVKDGLIPNMFPEGQNEGLYHTADATLWFFHSIDRYVTITNDPLIIEELLPTLQEIIDHHMKGTRFGIGVDHTDKLLRQGAEKYQLTWMDAKVGDWVVTPRRGKAVEINALWYNALKLMEGWVDGPSKPFFSDLARQVFQSFNNRFWIADKEYLYDVVDGEKGDDDAFRPNQLFSISLKHPVLEKSHWEAVLMQCKTKLLTPVGLRTLSADHPEFKPYYEGDLRSRDAAYHQGTVWPWLIGPFIDAWIKVHPEDIQGARRFIIEFSRHLGDAGVGTISEIFDATEPYTPRGCMAQAWSIAEILRTWLKTGS